MKIAVIGSGIGGLAVALRLSVKGHRVTVFEKNDVPGGKMGQIKMNGYRFDTGPSLLTMPELVDELFELAGENVREYLEYHRLEVSCKYFFSNGKVLTAFSDEEKLKVACETVLGEPQQNIEKHLRNAAEIYRLTAGIFIFRSLHKFRNYFRSEVLQSMLKIGRLRFYKTMHRVNSGTFRSPELIQLFDRYATYNGSSPYRAPATLNVIAHLEHNLGACFPAKGMYSVVESLYNLALKKGVQFRFNTLVDKLLPEKNNSFDIQTGSTNEHFDAVVSDSDVKYLANHMMAHPRKRRINKAEPSTSALIFYWGVKRQFSELELHNILFSSNYHYEFEMLNQMKMVSADPTVYIFISSKKVKTDAPDGCENWFVMVNTQAFDRPVGEEEIKTIRRNVVSKINRQLNISMEEWIEWEETATPGTIEHATLSSNGALYGASSNSMFSAFMRHPNFLPGLKNLYFVGGSVHPGGGIPLCLASAKIVDHEFQKA